jgi:SAM-dependent methyltransferase
VSPATVPTPSLYRRFRRIGGKLLRKTPLARLLLPSADYRLLTRDEALAAQGATGWLRGLTARRQQKAYEGLLQQMAAGQPRIDLVVAAEAIRATGLERPSILEIGCGGGYYSAVLDILLDRSFDYRGIDYSPAMVETARRAFPGRDFTVGDACALAYPDGAFDIAFNGVSLMHILDFEKAIVESRRVARRHCLYHSVPVFADRPTTYLRKYAYGAPVVEVIFNRGELLDVFERAGLRLVATWDSVPYDVHPVTPEHSKCETFLLEVRP